MPNEDPRIFEACRLSNPRHCVADIYSRSLARAFPLTLSLSLSLVSDSFLFRIRLCVTVTDVDLDEGQDSSGRVSSRNDRLT